MPTSGSGSASSGPGSGAASGGARILTITVPATVETTFWGLRFRVTGESTWTDYNPGSVDIAVPAIDADGLYLYTLDGINSPAGNEATASEAGNEYSIRLKTSGGYGGWSDPFKASWEPDSVGPFSDAAELQEEFMDYVVALDFSDQESADRFFARCLTDAMDYLRGFAQVDALYLGTPTDSQFRRLRLLERRYAVIAGLKKAARMKALGMQAPLLMEESADILAVARDLKEELDGLIPDLTEGGDGPAAVQYLHPFSASDERIFARDSAW